MTNQHKPPEFSKLFLPFSSLITSSLQAEGARWDGAPSLWDALGKECCRWHYPVMGCWWPKLGWTGLETFVVPPRAARCCRHLHPSLPRLPRCPWTMDTPACCSAMAFLSGPGQRQGLSSYPAHRFGDTSPEEGPSACVLDGQGWETLQTTALTK